MRKALVVGINAYPRSPLKGCVNDAFSMASVLQQHENDEPNFEVRVLTASDTDLTRQALLVAMKNLFDGDPDVALLYFSGHGMQTATGGYLVTTDAGQTADGISMDEILTLANRSEARHKVIILDCCEAGAFGSPAVNGGLATHLAPGVCVMAATRPGEDALEEKHSGLFTGLVLDALRGGAANLRGDITPAAVYAHVDIALGAFDQRPLFKSNVSTFVSLRTVHAPLPAGALRSITKYFPQPEHQLALDPSYEFSHSSAAPENVAVLKLLQRLQSVGLVVPVDADYLYYAAVDSKGCKLTPLGQHYWRLAKKGKV